MQKKSPLSRKPKSNPLRKLLLPALATAAVASTSACYVGLPPDETVPDAGAEPTDGGEEPEPQVDAGIEVVPEAEPDSEPGDAGTIDG